MEGVPDEQTTTARPRAARKRPTGRRCGDSGTREAILDAALQLFADAGFEATSMRSIAARAGVDPALIRHFYTDKETLFAEAMALRTVIPARLAEALDGDVATIGRRLTDTYLRLWEEGDTGPMLLGLLRASITTPKAAEMFIQTLSAHAGTHLPRPTPGEPKAEGFALAASHLLGLVMARHILMVPVVVAMSRERLVDLASPAIQQYLSGSAD